MFPSDKAADLHPATTTLIMISLLLMCGLPLAAWITLEKTENPVAARLWFGGLGLNACASIMLIFADGPWKPLFQALAHTMTLSGVIMVGHALRSSRQLPSLPKWFCYGLPGIAFFITLVAGLAGVAEAIVRSTFLFIASLIYIWLITEAVQLYRIYRYRSMLLVAGMLALVFAATMARSLTFFLVGMSPLLPSFTPTAMLAWAVNISAVVLCSFGYWSFALERAHEAELQARQDSAEAKARAEQAEAYNETLSRLVRERDEMIILNSRMTGLTGASIFGAGVIHELNQYLEALTARLGAANLLAPGADVSLQAQLAEASALTDTITASVRPLRDLMVSGSPKVEPVVVAAEVDAVCQIVASECARRGIRFEADLSPRAQNVRCLCDRVLLRRIVINLVTNAMQEVSQAHAPAGDVGWISLRLDLDSDGDARALRLEVADNGRGFPAEMLQQPLQLLRTHKEQGLGIGLVLTKMVLTSWSGAISLANEGGARVTITIPAAESAGAEGAQVRR